MLVAARGYERSRLWNNFTGLGRIEFAATRSPALLVVALLARQGRHADAWQCWESDLARGLFDDLAARRRPLSSDERHRQEDLIGQLDRLDNQIGALAGAKNLSGDKIERLDALEGQRLGLQGRIVELEAKLVEKYKVAVGAAYSLDQIQAQLPANAAMVGWLDLKTMPGAADPRGDHWAYVVRRSGAPQWIRIVGTGRDRAWAKDDDERPRQVRQLLSTDTEKPWQKSLAGLVEQRLSPLEAALGAHDGLPPARHLIILPSPAMAGVPIEALLEARPPAAPHYLVSYTPSGTLFAWLQERRREGKNLPEQPRRLFALGDPVPLPSDGSNPPAPKPPDHGLLVQQVEPGSNAEQAGVRPGDVLLQYAGANLANLDDLRKQLQTGGPKAKSCHRRRLARRHDARLEPPSRAAGSRPEHPARSSGPPHPTRGRSLAPPLPRRRLRPAPRLPPRGPGHRRALRPA